MGIYYFQSQNCTDDGTDHLNVEYHLTENS